MTAIRLVISGHVQGVCYRATTCDIAHDLGINGWVRNLENGDVEIHAEGPFEAIDALELWCHQGPPAAKVTQVVRTQVDEEGHDDFYPKYH